MSRSTINTGISTGNITFSKNGESASVSSDSSTNDQGAPSISRDAPMHIVLLADFTGRASRDIVDTASLAKRKPVEIDRDNFEEVFSALNVQIKLPMDDEVISFADYDDLHPDYLFENLPLFEKFRRLQRQLKKPEYFEKAAAEIAAWSTYQSTIKSSVETREGAIEPAQEPSAQDASNMLDAILSNSSGQAKWDQSPQGQIDRLIKDIVSPYVEQKTDPRLNDMQQAVELAVSESMRKIMHADQFQQLEGAWRSLYLLVRRLETNSQLKLFILDVSKQEVLADIDAVDGDLEKSGLYKALIENRSGPGQVPFRVINADFYVEDALNDILLTESLAVLAKCVGGTAVVGGSPKIAGCENLSASVDPDDWSYTLDETFQSHWHDVLQQDHVAHLAVVAPKFMLRLPYGKKSSPVENFDFEELPESGQHRYYLWGNSAYLVTLLLAQNYSQQGWRQPSSVGQIENLPLHVYKNGMESEVKPCAEVLLTDRAAQRLAENGFLSIRSIKDKDAVLVSGFTSAKLGETLKGGWSGVNE